jgi:SAM-dependent methyltransferase
MVGSEVRAEPRDVLVSENAVAEYYSHDGSLEQQILDALAAVGADPEHLEPEQLAAVDEFHTGGRLGTVALVDQLDLRPGLRVLDVGSGLGGTARYLARHHDVDVVGVDLTEEYVRVASSLSRRTGLTERVTFRQGTATALPLPDDAVDRACMLHVGMNVADKATLFAEVRRVLVDGGLFGIYDIMRTGSGTVAYPVPWASTPVTSFLAEPRQYRQLLTAAGLPVHTERDRREFGLTFFQKLRAAIVDGCPPPLGPHIVMGRDAAVKVANLVDNFARAVLAPTEMICG